MKTKKLNRFLILGLFIFIIISSCFFTTLIRAEEKPLVAVLPFEEGDFSWKGFQGDEILNGITQLVTDKLVQVDEIRVIERNRIEEIMDEQDFGDSGRVVPSSAAEIGKILGVDAMVMGTLTMLDVGESGGISLGPLSAKGIKAKVTLSGRVVNATTGEIKDSFKAKGEASETSIGISDLHGLSFGSKSFMSSALGKSIDQAVYSFSENIISNPDKLISHSKIIKGKVVKILGDKLIINIGSSDDIKKKQRGKLIRMVEVEELDDMVSMPVGKIQVYSVNEKSAILVILEEDDEPKKGDYVQIESVE